MPKPELWVHFFKEQHRGWKDRAYTLIQFTCKKDPIVSNYGKCVKKDDKQGTDQPHSAYRPKRDRTSIDP